MKSFVDYFGSYFVTAVHNKKVNTTFNTLTVNETNFSIQQKTLYNDPSLSPSFH